MSVSAHPTHAPLWDRRTTPTQHQRISHEVHLHVNTDRNTETHAAAFNGCFSSTRTTALHIWNVHHMDGMMRRILSSRSVSFTRDLLKHAAAPPADLKCAVSSGDRKDEAAVPVTTQRFFQALIVHLRAAFQPHGKGIILIYVHFNPP